MSSSPQWYTIKQAAEYLSIGEPTLYRWMRDSKITVRKVGDSTRFLQEDLDSCIQVIPSKKDVEKLKKLCSSCHSEDIVKGNFKSTGKNYFAPEKSKFWTFKDSNVGSSAYMCCNCGAITLFGDTEKLESLRIPDKKED
ncbi:helix-turn-helix domain-containing protein [Lentisphaera profundi]|uniref:Helix-turn-helix domain-containing protein n=1 Tax=Lentisphaera profundi TaxID=1658616 RepID=A0ABY7VTM3_9BACT|nr:helix-turn-helix domain-containing protein [Lentisphaera profundi]WDE96659.1 helix-turn-helix domain-containing protein [Lentisphaera profundi]